MKNERIKKENSKPGENQCLISIQEIQRQAWVMDSKP
jgi:hypothetical protein